MGEIWLPQASLGFFREMIDFILSVSLHIIEKFIKTNRFHPGLQWRESLKFIQGSLDGGLNGISRHDIVFTVNTLAAYFQWYQWIRLLTITSH